MPNKELGFPDVFSIISLVLDGANLNSSEVALLIVWARSLTDLDQEKSSGPGIVARRLRQTPLVQELPVLFLCFSHCYCSAWSSMISDPNRSGAWITECSSRLV